MQLYPTIISTLFDFENSNSPLSTLVEQLNPISIDPLQTYGVTKIVRENIVIDHRYDFLPGHEKEKYYDAEETLTFSKLVNGSTPTHCTPIQVATK